MKIAGLFALLLLGGCATCREHPVACTVASAIMVGAIAVGVHNSHNDSTHTFNIYGNPECADGVIGSDFNPACHKGPTGPFPFVHPIGH
jgi:hypothetical protein